VAKEKKRKKETSAVKYNTSGHYRGRRYNQPKPAMYTYLLASLKPETELVKPVLIPKRHTRPRWLSTVCLPTESETSFIVKLNPIIKYAK